ncbi:MAG: hypothetical protein U0412_00090 [Nitrospira sp.]
MNYRIPLPNEIGRFLHRGGAIRTRNFDLKAVTLPLNFSYQPFFWIGNDQHGVFWFCQTTNGWENFNDKDAIGLIRTADGLALNMSVAIRGDPNGYATHSFGLLPTPIKKLPQDWRLLRMVPAVGGNAYVVWPNEGEMASPYFGYPGSTKPEQMTRIVSGYRRGGVTALPYACPTWIATKTPEWLLNRADWEGGVVDRAYSVTGKDGQFRNVCTAAKSWKRFVRERFGEFIEEFHLTGLYMDNAQVYAIQNCIGAERNEMIDHPIVEQREGYISIMRSLRQNSARTLGVVHSSGGLNLPTFSVVDAWVSGEQFRGKVQRDYLEVASLLDFRVELNSRQWGIISIFLPEFSGEQAREVWPTRKLMSILMLHDVTPWPQWANVEEINRALRLLDAFGTRDAEFVPYYADHPLVVSSAPGVLVSSYVKGSESLHIAANLTKEDLSPQFCLGAAQSAGAPQLVNWFSRKPIRLADGCFELEIAAGEYAMFYSKNERYKADRR